MGLGEPRIIPGRRREVPVIAVVRPDCVLDHDGRSYAEGELVRLGIEDARRLEGQGVIARLG